ncbi:hypothetical protein GUJ93_ZPchr0160g6433 [Zizania palustris]|uniref:Uncharacterized protein n=1 Tax=Zizania palustris TaxID=103762 RepID=A0A8J5X5Z3_ZIZPA|nr:hypothetical protein GUJ93_ZPchr0160g6433 [Zizania palustris]
MLGSYVKTCAGFIKHDVNIPDLAWTQQPEGFAGLRYRVAGTPEACFPQPSVRSHKQEADSVEDALNKGAKCCSLECVLPREKFLVQAMSC